MDKRITDEKNRIYALLDRAQVKDSKRDAIEDIIENACFMKVKLEEARESLIDAPIVTEYTNGEKQKGTHPNPLFKAYTDLFKAYLSAMDKIITVLPKAIENELKPIVEDDNIIELVRGMKHGRKSGTEN